MTPSPPALRARPLLALLLGTSLLGALPAAAAWQTGSCSTSSLADGAFSACFPVSPAAATSLAGPGGRARLWSAEFRHGLYIALDAPLAGDASSAAARLVARLDGRMVAVKPGTFAGGKPALRFWFTLDAKREGKGIFVLRGGRLYGLLAVTPAKDAAMAARFLASLALPATAKAAEAGPGRASDWTSPSPSPGARAMGERIAAALSTNDGPRSTSSADSTPSGAEPQPAIPAVDVVYPDSRPLPGGFLAKLQNFESAGNPNAVNLRSSAVGPYQFTTDTWNDVWSRNLRDRGIVNDPTDPTAAAMGADAYTKENAATLTKVLGRTPTDSELAMAHVFGPMGATRLLEGNPYEPATEFASPQVVSANARLFYDADGTSKTAGELKGHFDRRFGTGNTALAGPVGAPQALIGAGRALEMARALMFPNGQLFLGGFEMAKPYLATAQKMLPAGYYIGADYDIHASVEYAQGEASIGGAKKAKKRRAGLEDDGVRLDQAADHILRDRMRRESASRDMVTLADFAGDERANASAPADLPVARSPQAAAASRPRPLQIAMADITAPDDIPDPHADPGDPPPRNPEARGQTRPLRIASPPPANAPPAPPSTARANLAITPADEIPDPHADLTPVPPSPASIGGPEAGDAAPSPPANAPAAPPSATPGANLALEPPSAPVVDETVTPLPPGPASIGGSEAGDTVPPPPAHQVWRPGAWRWNGYEWEWQPARWDSAQAAAAAPAPPAHRIWRPGAWRWSGYRWEWQPGRWDWAPT